MFDSPWATAPNTSRSFSVSPRYDAGGGVRVWNWPSRSVARSWGASTALPAYTVRIASRSITGVVPLSRKPLAPYRIAVAARSSRLNVVSTIDAHGPLAAGDAVGQEDLPGRLDAVHLGHPDVHQDDVGGELVDQPHRLDAVAGGAHDLEARPGRRR